MTVKSIAKFFIGGDSVLQPRRVENFLILQWAAWKEDAVAYFLQAGPFLDVESPSETLHATCLMYWDKMHFTVYENEKEMNTPNSLYFDINPSTLGRDDYQTYALLRNTDHKDFSAINEQRIEIHERMVRSVLEKLKKEKLGFRDGDSAISFLSNLTSYWFDLLYASGKLDPRNRGTPRVRADGQRYE